MMKLQKKVALGVCKETAEGYQVKAPPPGPSQEWVSISVLN